MCFFLLSILTLFFVVSLLFSFPWQGTVDFIVFIYSFYHKLLWILFCLYYSLSVMGTVDSILSLLLSFYDGYCGFYSVFITLFLWWVLWILCCLYYSPRREAGDVWSLFDVCVCIFYVCEVIGFVDWLDRRLIYMWEEFRNVPLLMTWVWLSWGDPVWLTGH